jgi:maltooligosyltrehalose trehalohydrolase
MNVSRRLPVGAEVWAKATHFRVWAPACRTVEVVIEGGQSHPLAAESEGYFSAEVPGVGAGARYRFRLDKDDYLYPDPASR